MGRPFAYNFCATPLACVGGLTDCNFSSSLLLEPIDLENVWRPMSYLTNVSETFYQTIKNDFDF